MKLKSIKIIQIFLVSVLVSVGMLAVFGSFALAAKQPPEYCTTEDSCKDDGYTFVRYDDKKDRRAKLCIGEDKPGRCLVDASIKLNVPIPGSGDSVRNINTYVDNLFKWLLQLGGVIAAAVIVWGGYIYITAAGNQAKISQAKETITGGIIGLVLLFGSVTLLGFFNQRILENLPNAIDKVNQKETSFKFCTSETPKPKKVTCGSPAKNADGSGCISKYCGDAKKSGEDKLVCVPITLKVGLGLSDYGSGYSCVKNDYDTLSEACEESKGIRDFEQCNYISQLLRKKTPVDLKTACGFGISLDNNTVTDPDKLNTVKECKLDDWIKGSNLRKKRVECSNCKLDTKGSDLLKGSVASGVFTKDNDATNVFRFFCADPGTVQTEWDEKFGVVSIGIDDLYYAGAICMQRNDGTYYILIRDDFDEK